MANVTGQTLKENKQALATVLEEMKATFDKIRKRAFEIFLRRGAAPGLDLEDWVQAEHELLWVPQAELAETDAEFRIKVGVPGFEAKDLDMTAHPSEILLQAHTEKRQERAEREASYSEFGMKSLFRRFALTAPIEIGAVTAGVESGTLTVIVPKKTKEEKEAEKKIAVAAEPS